MQRLIAQYAAAAAAVLLAGVCHAQPPEMPKPTKEHELLAQFAGEWEVTAETVPMPGQEAFKCTGTESAKMVGGFWLIGRNESSVQGMAMSSVLTIGYNPVTKKYFGTFLCSADSTLWKYVGAMDETGKKLTLETEGPLPFESGPKAKFREVLELKDKDHKTFTTYMDGGDGNWVKFVTLEYRRKP